MRRLLWLAAIMLALCVGALSYGVVRDVAVEEEPTTQKVYFDEDEEEALSNTSGIRRDGALHPCAASYLWDTRQPLLVDADNTNGFFLYALPGEEKGLLIYADPDAEEIKRAPAASTVFDWRWMGWFADPEIKNYKVDNNTKQVAVKVCVTKGTGAYTDDLHIIEVKNIEVKNTDVAPVSFDEYYFSQEDIQAQLDKAIKAQVSDPDDKDKARITLSDGKRTVSGSLYEASMRNLWSFNEAGYPHYEGYIKFEFDNNGIKLFSAVGICAVTADVHFNNGKFILKNIALKQD